VYDEPAYHLLQRALLRTLSVVSVGIWNGICVVLAHMQSHDLTRLRIHSKECLIVDDLYGLGIGIDLPVVGQNMLNDKRNRRGGHILEKVFLLRNCDLVALHHAVPKSLLDMVRGEYALQVADSVVISKIRFGKV